MRSIARVLIFLLISVVFTVSYGQDQDPEQAKEYMEVAEGMIEGSMAYDDVRDIVVIAADLDTTYIKANFMAGDLHLRTIGKDLAVKYFLRVYRQDPEYRFDIEYWIGKSYQLGLKFDKAITFYKQYLDKLSKKSNYQGKDKIDRGEVQRAIYECENGKEFVSHPGHFSIVNIGREINSEFEDYAPVFNEKEDEIVFTSRRREDNLNENVYEDNKPFEDIYYSKKVNGQWQRAKNIGAPVNNPYHGSDLSLSPDGNTLYIYQDENGGDIYYCRRVNGTWTEPVPLPGVINSSYEEKSISISRDEKTLYFTSDRPGGFGGTDIYKATKDSKGHWSNVRNLGPKINTEYDEDGTFIDLVDGVTFYFSSKGHKGMGGFDIFKTTFNPSTNDWSEPENLGYPINTPDDDVYFVTSPDGTRAYYSSVREDGMGYTDIYVITIPEGLKNTEPVTKTEPVEEEPEEEPVVTKVDPVITTPITREPVKEPVKEPIKEPIKEPVKEPVKEPKKELTPVRYVVTVIDATTDKPIEARIRLQGLKDNMIVGSSSLGIGATEFLINDDNAKEYRLSVELEGYAFVNESVKLPGRTSDKKYLTKIVELSKLTTNVSKVLRNIYFDFDKATFKDESYNELNKLERMMKENNNISVEISGHTDNIGASNYNMFLSRKRAEAVKDFLTQKGVDSRRIKAVGYGEKKPLVSNDDENQGREINRRVEFKVIKH